MGKRGFGPIFGREINHTRIPSFTESRIAVALASVTFPESDFSTPKKNTIMAQAIIDPEEVRRFAKELKRFNDDVQARAGSLQARFTALGSTWQDQEAEKFADEFITTMKVLKKFVEIAEKHTPYLLRKAQRIEEYLDQR